MTRTGQPNIIPAARKNSRERTAAKRSFALANQNWRSLTGYKIVRSVER
jgi:hypothetical protein